MLSLVRLTHSYVPRNAQARNASPMSIGVCEAFFRASHSLAQLLPAHLGLYRRMQLYSFAVSSRLQKSKNLRYLKVQYVYKGT
jgi:hypothetical protein